MKAGDLVVTGVIICEGLEEDANEFVHRLRQLRWKVVLLAVTAERYCASPARSPADRKGFGLQQCHVTAAYDFLTVIVVVCHGDSCLREWLDCLALSYVLVHRCLAARVAGALKLLLNLGTDGAVCAGNGCTGGGAGSSAARSEP